MPWFPHFATRAYVETLELRSILEQQRPSRSGRPRIVEPANAEVLSALAAGINAQHILQVGCGLSTVALAAAAKATGSYLASLHTDAEKQKIVGRCLQLCGLSDYVQFFCGDPCDIVSRRQDIDFIFIGGDADIYIALFDLLNLKPGAIVVADYALDDSTNDYIKHVRRQPGIDSSTLPVGRGLEITKIPIAKWNDFKNGRTRYVGSSSPGPSRPVDIEDTHSSQHSDVLSESASSLHSNPTSVSSVFAAEAWMASKAAKFHTGNSDGTEEVETYAHAAQELALSVNSSISSVHAAEAWMAAQAVKAFYSNSRDDDDEYYELEPERHDAGDMAHHVNGNASDHSDFDEGSAKYDDSHIQSGQKWQSEDHNHDAEELPTPRNGFLLGQTDHKSEKPDALDVSRQAEVQDGDPERYVLQESVLLPNRISCHKVEADKNTKHKSTLSLPNIVTGKSESARLEDFQSCTGFGEGYSHNESATGAVCLEPLKGITRKLQASEELHRQSQPHSEYVGDLLSHGTVVEQKFAADALENMEQEPKFEITFQDEDCQTAVMIRGVDQDMLLFDITMAFNESGVSVRRAKINTTMEKYIEDIFYVVDSKTGTALDISSWDTVRGRLLAKLTKP